MDFVHDGSDLCTSFQGQLVRQLERKLLTVRDEDVTSRERLQGGGLKDDGHRMKNDRVTTHSRAQPKYLWDQRLQEVSERSGGSNLHIM